MAPAIGARRVVDDPQREHAIAPHPQLDGDSRARSRRDGGEPVGRRGAPHLGRVTPGHGERAVGGGDRRGRALGRRGHVARDHVEPRRDGHSTGAQHATAHGIRVCGRKCAGRGVRRAGARSCGERGRGIGRHLGRCRAGQPALRRALRPPHRHPSPSEEQQHRDRPHRHLRGRRHEKSSDQGREARREAHAAASREREQRRHPRPAVAPVAAVELGAQELEATLAARARGLDGYAMATRDLARREAVEPAERDRAAVRLVEREDGVDDAAALGHPDHGIGRGGCGIGAGRGGLTREAAAVAAAEAADDVPGDAGQPGEGGVPGTGRMLETDAHRLLGHVVGRGIVRHERPGETPDGLRVGGEGIGVRGAGGVDRGARARGHHERMAAEAGFGRGAPVRGAGRSRGRWRRSR